MNTHPLRPARLAGLVVALALTLVLVWSIPVAALPGLGVPADDWFGRVGPAEGMLAVLRVVIIVALLYLLAATLLLLATTSLGSRPLAEIANRCTAPALQRFLRTSAGLGIGTVASLHPLAAGAQSPLTDELPEPAPVESAEPAAEEVTTLTRVEDPAPDDGRDSGRAAAVAAPGEAEIGTPGASRSGRAEPTDWWTVAPGDHLWLIAEETVADQGATARSPDDTARYWQLLCQANHDRLLDPDNPDLIVPGQRIVLPPPSVTP